MIEVIYREEKDRWIPGDRYVRRLVRHAVRGKNTRMSGMQRVVSNFRKGLELKQISYRFNSIPQLIKPSSKVISFGLGADGVAGLNRNIPVIAAIGFPYPRELPDLCEKYNVQKFLQHSQWVLDLVKSANLYDDTIFDLWPAGIDVDEWQPNTAMKDKTFDVLLYDKVYWEREERKKDLISPIKTFLELHKFSYEEIRYGHYHPLDYKRKLAQCKVMIFMSAHESQGIAYQECMACDVPVIAWNPGLWLDPVRFNYGKTSIPATSVPFFDDRCGMTFKDIAEFEEKFCSFFSQAQSGKYLSREFVVENLSIEKSTARMLEIYNSI